MPRPWLYKKPNTEEGLWMIEDGKDVYWAKTIDDKFSGDFKQSSIGDFCQMKSNEGYELDENTFFTIVGMGKVAGISPRKDPCQDLRT